MALDGAGREPEVAMAGKNLRELPKIRDSLSFIYLEHGRLEREDHALAVWDDKGQTHVPVAALSLLMLGPGTRISHEAMKLLCENGCSVVWVGEHGVRMYGQGLGETRSARRLLIQARLHSDPVSRAAVVLKMYQMRFGERLPVGLTLEQIRGREGVRVRTAYARLSAETGVPWTARNYDRRDWYAADPVNRALSAGSACLYGICHAAIVSAGYSPALGFVHTGKLLSFVYDIADLYRIATVVPVAFRATAAFDGADGRSLERDVRLRCRDAFREHKILDRVVHDIDELMSVTHDDLERSTHLFDGVDDAPGSLWDPDQGEIDGGRNHGDDPGEERADEPEG
jgi:CRISPR-associated protein Cas1